MTTTDIATIAHHPGHKVIPFLNDGIITPGALLDWENACDDFFVAAKEPIPENKKVSKVTVGLQNLHMTVYIRNIRVCLHTLTFSEFLSKLCGTFLLPDWDTDTLQTILAARMTLDQSFYNCCANIVTLNSRLAGPLYLTEERIKEHIFNNMTQDLCEKVEKFTAMLAALNALPFQKWFNTISEIDISITKMIKENDESENLGVVAITSPSAVAPGDWDPDDNSGAPPLTILNLYW